MVLRRTGVVIAGYYGFGNAGDELILYSLIEKFRRETPDIVLTVLSNSPGETAQSYGVHALNRWHPWTWLGSFLHAQLFILGGGGLLQETTGPWNCIYYLVLVILAKILGCSTDVWAIGVDPIISPVNRFLTRQVMNYGVDRVSVRDAVSRDSLISAGVSRLIELQPDPVFELRLESAREKPNGIALALSPWKGRPQWATEVGELCLRLSAKVNVPIDLLVMFSEEDAPFARDVARHSGVRSVREWEKPTDLLTWIPHYQLVLGTRYHALVLAALGDIPFIGWGSQNKVFCLCGERHRPSWNIAQGWNLEWQLSQISSFYQTHCKSVILETRMG